MLGGAETFAVASMSPEISVSSLLRDRRRLRADGRRPTARTASQRAESRSRYLTNKALTWTRPPSTDPPMPPRAGCQSPICCCPLFLDGTGTAVAPSEHSQGVAPAEVFGVGEPATILRASKVRGVRTADR